MAYSRQELDQLSKQQAEQVDELNTKLNEYYIFKAISEQLHIPPYVSCCLVFMLIAVIFYCFEDGLNLLLKLLGIIFPLFFSWQSAVDNDDNSSYWLKYWCIFVLSVAIDNLFRSLFMGLFVLIGYWKAYKIMMNIYLLCLVIPPYTLSLFVFDYLLFPLFLKHQESITTTLDTLKSTGTTLTKDTISNISLALQSVSKQVVLKGMASLTKESADEIRSTQSS